MNINKKKRNKKKNKAHKEKDIVLPDAPDPKDENFLNKRIMHVELLKKMPMAITEENLMGAMQILNKRKMHSELLKKIPMFMDGGVVPKQGLSPLFENNHDLIKADASTVTESPPVTDASTVTESLSATESPPVTDASTVTESLSATESPPVTDASTVTESLSATESPPVTDASTVTESLSATESPPKQKKCYIL